jgi:predicted TIM-barrel fold metal-dependent hydrolase
MPDYREYLESSFHDDFDAFVKVFRDFAPRDFDRPTHKFRLDATVYDPWIVRNGETGRMDGAWDPQRRLAELEEQGVVAEVLFPDFGRPFELSPLLLAALHQSPPGPAHIEAANRAYNRWLVDFCHYAPARLLGMAVIDFHDVDDAMAQITWAAEAGLKGVVLPKFEAGSPLYSPRYDPIWSLVEDLGLPVNSHIAMSAITNYDFDPGDVPHPACTIPIASQFIRFFSNQVLAHFVWGGVLERHPKLKVVLTEQGSSWIPSALETMDYTYERSWLRRDIREVVRHTPSEYFARQCYLGSSLFSLAEVRRRYEIGLDKMMMGVDYPHHEGTWHTHDTQAYLRATFGAAHVPENEARLMLGDTAAAVFNADVDTLALLASKIGPDPSNVLTTPTEDLFPRGDVPRPFV